MAGQRAKTLIMGAITRLPIRSCRHGKPLEEGEWIALLRELDPVNRRLMLELTRSLYGRE